MPLQHIPKLHHFFYALPANSWLASQNLHAYSTHGAAHSRQPLLSLLWYLYHLYLNTPILQAQPLTDWDRNPPECHAASHKTNEKHSGSRKTSLPVHTKQTKWVSVHTTTLNPPHTRTFIPEDGFRKKLAKQTYLTLLTTLLQFQGYESLCQSVCKLTILTYRSFTLYLNAEK